LLAAHIFFDDAFVIGEDRVNYVINSFVKDLVEVMPEACALVHETESSNLLSPPKKYATPYGGRLVWTLPGKTKIICHLKDKNKIRHRKRWSQVQNHLLHMI
jgi:chitin synthase